MIELAAPLPLIAYIAYQLHDDGYWQSVFDGTNRPPLYPDDALPWYMLTVLGWIAVVVLMRPLTAKVHTARPAQSRYLVCVLLTVCVVMLAIDQSWCMGGGRGGNMEVQHWLPTALLGWAVYARLGWIAPKGSNGAGGACARCGYSLVGLRAGDPCPECGALGSATHESPK